MSTPVAIVDGLRTPFVKAGGEFSFVSAQELGRVATAELLAQSQIDPNHVDEVIFGNVAQPMDATNIGRVVALQAGLPMNISAHTVSRNCASGMQSIATGVDLIQNGRSHIVIAGGGRVGQCRGALVSRHRRGTLPPAGSTAANRIRR